MLEDSSLLKMLFLNSEKNAGLFTCKVFYGMDVSGKEIIFYIHAPESVFRYGNLIPWEGVL